MVFTIFHLAEEKQFRNAGKCLLLEGERCAAAAGGRKRQCGFSAAVGKHKDQRKPEVFSGHRKVDGWLGPISREGRDG